MAPNVLPFVAFLCPASPFLTRPPPAALIHCPTRSLFSLPASPASPVYTPRIITSVILFFLCWPLVTVLRVTLLLPNCKLSYSFTVSTCPAVSFFFQVFPPHTAPSFGSHPLISFPRFEPTFPFPFFGLPSFRRGASKPFST